MSMLDYLAVGLVTSLAYFSFWFFIAAYKKRFDLADIAWGGGFITIALAAIYMNWESLIYYPQLLTTVLVIVWGLRLGLHIYARNKGKHEDSRYVELRKKWKGSVLLNAYFRVFIVQALLLFIVALPILATAAATDFNNSDFLLGLGFTIWLIGFIVESVADWQLSQHIKSTTSKKKVMDKGLWSWSRHPNYFGEVCVWWGIWLISLSINPVWWSIIGPLTLTGLILFVSGIPLLEKKYARDKHYQEYARRTSKFIPLPPR